VLRIVLVVVACAVVLYLAYRLRTVIRLAVISLFLALALLPIVDALDRSQRLPRAAIILAEYLVLAVTGVVIGDLVVPSMVKEVGQLSHDAPRYARELRSNATFRHYDNRYKISAKLVQDARHLPERLGHLVGPLKQVTVQAFSFIGQLVTVLALTFPLLLHGREYVEMGLGDGRDPDRAVDPRRPIRARAWIRGGLLRPDPARRRDAGAIVVALATVTVSFPVATIVWIVFIILWQRFEDYVVQPLVYRRALHVNPLVTIVAVLVGAELLGILGALIAIPIAAAIQILLHEWWSSRAERRSQPTG
jgi:predicted PurR-regulated permease PerM